MAHGKPGRPPAAELGERACGGRNAHGGSCGNPRIPDMAYCLHHLGEVDRSKAATTSERLRRMTDRALDALDQVLATGPPDARVRAAKLILDRVAPVAGPYSIAALVVPAPAVETSPSDRIRTRLLELASRTESAPDPEIIDAVIVDEEPAPEAP